MTAASETRLADRVYDAFQNGAVLPALPGWARLKAVADIVAPDGLDLFDYSLKCDPDGHLRGKIQLYLNFEQKRGSRKPFRWSDEIGVWFTGHLEPPNSDSGTVVIDDIDVDISHFTA